jgi:PilZ domain
MSTGTDRREARRFTMTLPLQVMSGADSEVRTQTRDVSYRGLYFFTEKHFRAGNAIEFVITLPEDVTGGDVKIKCQGEIVRVDPGENGRLGVAAKIAHYEFIPTTTAA